MSSEVHVKKVKPYPFEVQLVRNKGGETIKGSVVKLSQHGFLVEIDGFLPIIQDDYTGHFTLPTQGDYPFDVKLIVIKTYDSFREKVAQQPATQLSPETTPAASAPEGPITVHLAEMHFMHPSTEQVRRVTNWLKTIGQVTT